MKTRRGFTLIEMLAAIILLGAILGLSCTIVVTALKNIGQANAHMTQGRSLDAAIAELRKDAWGSARFTQVDAATLQMQGPGGADITWTLRPNLVLRRSQAVAGGAAVVRNFGFMPADLALATRDGMIVLQSKDSSGRDASVSLPSQFLLGGGKP